MSILVAEVPTISDKVEGHLQVETKIKKQSHLPLLNYKLVAESSQSEVLFPRM